MKRLTLLTIAVLVGLSGCATFRGAMSIDAPNQRAIEEVASGKRQEANAAWWGFTEEDSTKCLQAALDSGARTVVVPKMYAPWTVTPLTLGSDIEVVFEPGVVVMAKKGEFKGRGDSLFRATNQRNITLRGQDAVLRMRKADYQSDAYERAEWRMCLSLSGCTGLHIEGLHLESSGGDGIYLGATTEQPYCKDVVIRNVVCHDNHRQGISVIGAENLLIEDCVLSNTGGTSPEAGIDLEPNHDSEKLVNCIIRRCVMVGNDGAGVLLYLKNLSKATAPVSVYVEDCLMRNNKDAGIAIGAVKDDGPQGVIEFRNCTIDGSGWAGAYVYDKSAQNVRVRFVDCTWRNVWPNIDPKRDGPQVPLLINLARPQLTEGQGGIDFVDCHVYDDKDRPVLVAEEGKSAFGLRDVTGTITVHNPHGARADFGPNPANVGLQVVPASE